VPVLVEMRVPIELEGAAILRMASAKTKTVPAFKIDKKFKAIPMASTTKGSAELKDTTKIVVVSGTIDKNKIVELESQPNIVKVWSDGHIDFVSKCPFSHCDCIPFAKGTIDDVANYLGAKQIWANKHKGENIVIGIVDSGIAAIGRTPKPGETAIIPRVIGGYPPFDWGTTSHEDHGNLCATDALGMAPEAQLYDIRISEDPNYMFRDAIAGYDWAIKQHRATGTPQILSNSWAIYRANSASQYATDPNHPFTRKVVEALDEGIIILFAAGNCGATCMVPQCNGDNGPGKSIWGANGHPRVMTVGAANLKEQFVGYSSEGPSALDPSHIKPDFCSITHFKGYTSCDSGTSAATPIAAGIVALIKQAEPAVTQDEVKEAIKRTAKQIDGGRGWNQHSGAGILQGLAAYNLVRKRLRYSSHP
jgi:subtilisin family serine protease